MADLMGMLLVVCLVEHSVAVKADSTGEQWVEGLAEHLADQKVV